MAETGQTVTPVPIKNSEPLLMDSQRKDVFADNEGLRSGVGEQAFGLDMEKERRRIFRIQQRSSQ
ncbi:hypothetical protein AGATL06_00260 [Agathobaculum sp. TL06]|jgi:hypothetical protein